jgi:uncharacterized damage-inducible protein DinB
MTTPEHFTRLFLYDDRANRQVAANLRAASAPPPQALKLIAHILAAERLWLERLNLQEQTLPVWPELTLEQCADQAAELTLVWKHYLNAQSERDLGIAVTYKNSKGESWSSRKDDILMHVVLHSAYHRRQAASAMRAAGFTPAYTDFIYGIR